MRAMPVKDFPRLTDGLAQDTHTLIDQLDQHIPPATVTAGMDLDDPKVRAALMLNAGRRDVVEQLKKLRDRKP